MPVKLSRPWVRYALTPLLNGVGHCAEAHPQSVRREVQRIPMPDLPRGGRPLGAAPEISTLGGFTTQPRI